MNDFKGFQLVFFPLLLVLLLSCQKKEEFEIPSEWRQGLEDSSLHCEENFVASWCGENRLTSDIVEICAGQVAIGDQLLPAVSLATGQGSRCFASTGVQEEVSFPGCVQAKRNQYMGDLKGESTLEALVCYSQGEPAYLEGTSSEGQAFSVFHIE